METYADLYKLSYEIKILQITMMQIDCAQFLKALSVTTTVVGLQTDAAGHVGQNSSTHVARVVGLQTDAVIVTETRLRTVIVVVYRPQPSPSI